MATVDGQMLRRWDQRTQQFRPEYDELRRSTHLHLRVGSGTETLLERRYYGDNAGVTAPEDDNLRGKPIAAFDAAGLTKLGPYDFKGNLKASSRTLTPITSASTTPNWSALQSVGSAATAESTVSTLLETSGYGESRTFDALNRVKTSTAPDGSVYLPTYNIAGLLDAVDVEIQGGSATNFVKNIDYDAKGQRTLIEYSDNSGARFSTTYDYDPETFRLTRLVTTRTSPANTLQDLSYTFDAVGNIVRIADDADSAPLFEVDPNNRIATYTYDPIYRLIAATGREHQSVGGAQVTDLDLSASSLPDPSDPTAVRQYAESYQYDVVGNIEVFFHNAGSGAQTWTRNYSYVSGTNRLASNSFGAGTASYTHDDHGNMTAMPHLAAITYTPFDQMQSADVGGGEDAYYIYDSSGTRVRKVIVQTTAITIERIYLGSYEIYRKHVSGDLDFERQTLHISDDTSRIAMVETKTWEDGDELTTVTPMLRFQLGNHLGSATLELDEDGLIISYEEYHPYGTSAYRSSNGSVDVSARRYRYTGKERDEETGLYYNGARYLAAWLGRWTSADPIGIGADGPGLYNYTRGSPIGYTDPSGTDGVRCDPNCVEITDAERAQVEDEATGICDPSNLGPLTFPDSQPMTPEEVRASADMSTEGRAGWYWERNNEFQDSEWYRSRVDRRNDQEKETDATIHGFSAGLTGFESLDQFFGAATTGEFWVQTGKGLLEQASAFSSRNPAAMLSVAAKELAPVVQAGKTLTDDKANMEARAWGGGFLFGKVAGAAIAMVGLKPGAPAPKPTTSGQFLYRGLAEGEASTVGAKGLSARAPGVPTNEVSHVAGKRQSQWISTSKSLKIADEKFGEFGVVEIDIGKLTTQTRDVSRGLGGLPDHYMLPTWSRSMQEVLVMDQIPAAAIRLIRGPR